MKEVRFIGTVKRNDWLGKPAWFSQSQVFDKEKAIQLNNRQVEVEYSYDIEVEIERELSKKEHVEMQNAISSIFMMHGDMACEPLFLWSRMYHGSVDLVKLMQGGDIHFNYITKRYVLANGNDIGFVSEEKVYIDNREKEQEVAVD